jgi:hypothetical protein
MLIARVVPGRAAVPRAPKDQTALAMSISVTPRICDPAFSAC